MPPALRVCAVDEDQQQHPILEGCVQGLLDVDLALFHDARSALDHLATAEADVLVVDAGLSNPPVEAVLAQAARLRPELPVVLLAPSDAVDAALDVLRHGAVDYLTKPIRQDLFIHRVLRLAEAQQLRRGSGPGPQDSASALAGRSQALIRARRRVEQWADRAEPVWVAGPEGAGRHEVAQALHDASARREAPFLRLEPLPGDGAEREMLLFGRELGPFTSEQLRLTGALGRASGGTLLLPGPAIDEGLYRRLIRSGRAPETPPRLVFAIDRPEDLPSWASADVLLIEVPALEARPEDIRLLSQELLETLNRRLCRRCYLTEESLAWLESRAWPGQIDELRALIRAAVLRTDGPITPAELGDRTLPRKSPGPAPEHFREEKARALRAFEADYLERLLRHARGHLTRAAARAGMDRKNLWKLLKKHDIDPSAFKPGGQAPTGPSARNQPEEEHG